MTSPFIEENDQTRARREHLAEIERLVGNAYPNKFRRTNLAGSPEGEDTITALVRPETLKRLAGNEEFGAAFDLLAGKAAAGERPSAEDLEPVNAGLHKLRVRVAGRVATPPRVMGKAAFVHLSDGRERLQIYVRKQDARAVSNDSGEAVEEPESGWRLFQLLDHGDFVGVEGFLFVTKTGELSVHVEQLQFLSKALVPMPDKLHGINDPEIRQRRRYADLIASSLKVEREPGELTTREVFERRSKMITTMRRYLDDHGYVEVETPILSPIASGAAAKPFETYHNALDIKLYARIAPELYLKRLLVGGFERVYELNRNFRNEGISYKHNPEFTMLEFYCAYMDANGMMDFCEEMLRTVIKNSTGTTQFQSGIPLSPGLTTILRRSNQIDFAQPFQRLTMKEAIERQWNAEDTLRQLKFNGEFFRSSWLDESKMVYLLYKFVFYLVTGAEIKVKVPREKLDTTDNPIVLGYWLAAQNDLMNLPDGADERETSSYIVFLFENMAEQSIFQPTFITDFPKVISPLSKASPENPAIAERFELYIAGMECANGFSELNDPVEQYARFEEQVRQRERGDEEAMQMDVDYVRALSYGMPPAAGIGIGIDRVAMLLTNRRSIRDVILFPHMRRQRQAAEATEEADETRG
ncbi:MAG: lysine--tRNA ligase [Acidobacteriota bacterium]|nr:lysine--tRNA ligase [Acidobacteriota bacterium]